jgi:hypothetical protein
VNVYDVPDDRCKVTPQQVAFHTDYKTLDCTLDLSTLTLKKETEGWTSPRA